MSKNIIFIQGIFGTKWGNAFLFRCLRGLGYEVIYFPSFYTVWSLDKHRGLINNINNFLLNSNDHYIIIGHSFGGILAYCLDEESYKKIDMIITVASPHGLKFNWFVKILSQLNYRKDVVVKKQKSYGFYFDFVVPFTLTKYPSGAHKNFFGEHLTVLYTNIIKKML